MLGKITRSDERNASSKRKTKEKQGEKTNKHPSRLPHRPARAAASQAVKQRLGRLGPCWELVGEDLARELWRAGLAPACLAVLAGPLPALV